MTRSSQRKEKYRNSSELPKDSYTEGTAARTRPFSFDDIMLKRKHKRKPTDVEEVIEGGRLLGENISEKVSVAVDFYKKRSKDSVRNDEKRASEDFVKVSSREKEVDTSLEEGKLSNAKNKESHRYERKSKTSPKKSNFVDRSKGGEISEQEYEKRSNRFPFDDSEKELDRRHSRERIEKEKHADRYRGTEKESKRTRWNEDDERTRDKNEVKKHDSYRWRESEPKEKREKKESSKVHNEDDERTRDKNDVKKHKYRWRESEPKEKREKKESSKVLNEDDERTRHKNEVKKHDLYKWREYESKDKREKKESSKVLIEDSRPKRRRSRSRDHAKDTGRRSTSLSPRAHKRVSHAVHDHGDLSAHSSKDRSGRSNPDFDSTRMSSNGSSGHNRRHGSSASKLGGYSPRKRRTEAAAKTPSPTIRSPEKRSAGWDRPPAKSVNIFNGPVLSSLQSSVQMVSSNIPDVSKMVPATSNMAVTVVGVTSTALSPRLDISADSVQLTQATRSSRRLYVQNLPAATSEESLMKCINNFILSSGGHHAQGNPCISCIINKEKNQALVEFFTPEDASAALNFDGETFEGSIVKVKRPKDFFDASTGNPRKSLAEVGLISKNVKDSPYKIFIGGISTSISSDMLMEITCAFGPVRAYHYEFNADLREPCVFLEYVDQSIMNRACAGLNGMKLGGKVLTVVQAMQNASLIENVENPPSYEIPSHAKPLLEEPTQVLKLKNVIDPKYLPLISETELEEMLEDIRVECARFGTIKSVNVVKGKNLSITPEAYEIQLNEIVNTVPAIDRANLEYDDSSTAVHQGPDHHDSEELGRSEPSKSRNEFEELTTDVDGNISCDDKLNMTDLSSCMRKPDNGDKTLVKNSTCEDKLMEVCSPEQEVDDDKVIEDSACQENSCDSSIKISNHFNTPAANESEIRYDTVDDNCKEELPQVESELSFKEDKDLTENLKLVSASSDLDHRLRKQLDGVEKDARKEQESDRGNVFELGSVLVEFRRTEASCMAAHGLHGRLFDERIVTVGYVNLDSYREKFPK